MIAVCSIVHVRGDTRIRVKQLPSMSRGLKGPVEFYVQDGEGDEFDSRAGVRIIDTGKRYKSRILRATVGVWRMYRAVKDARPDVVHFHDPELITMGLLMKLSGAKVVYDVHEDVPRQVLAKSWIPAVIRHPVSWIAAGAERLANRAFDGIFAATPTIARRFDSNKTILVQNFPLLGELVPAGAGAYADRPPCFAYVGGITSERGAREMVTAIGKMSASDARLLLAGAFYPESLLSELEELEGWQHVRFTGWATRDQVCTLLETARAGLVLFGPAPNHINAQPNKMFEYMAAGLPVIASDFPLWRGIIAEERCGLLVDPLDPIAIADAMRWVLDNVAEAEAMGRRGRDAIDRTYSWGPEADRLLGYYVRRLGCPQANEV